MIELELELSDQLGAGLEIRYKLPKGFNYSGFAEGADGESWFTTWYLTEPQWLLSAHERWVQFETKEWDKMQTELGNLFVASPKLHMYLEELYSMVMGECPSLLEDSRLGFEISELLEKLKCA